jgi:hypothetical protein
VRSALRARRVGQQAGFVDPRARRLQLLDRDALARGEVVVPQLDQHLAGLDAVAGAHQQPVDAPAQRRRQLGAAAGGRPSRRGCWRRWPRRGRDRRRRRATATGFGRVREKVSPASTAMTAAAIEAAAQQGWRIHVEIMPVSSFYCVIDCFF